MKKVIKVLLFLILFLNTSCIWKKQVYFPAKNNKNGKIETVIVLHGIARTNRQTYLLSKRISENGFEVYNITYPSTEYTIEELADYLNKEFTKLNLDKKENLNIVAHSLGGLVVRAYTNKYKPKNLEKIVMISTPNNGSELADFFKDWKIYKNFYGPAGQELTTNNEKLVKAIGNRINEDYEVGIIAGSTSFNPIFSSMLLGKDDGVVSVESTKLEGMDDHISLKVLHGVGLYGRKIPKLVISFLKDGKFDRKLLKKEKKYYKKRYIKTF